MVTRGHPLAFAFLGGGDKVGQWRAGIVDRFLSPLPFVGRVGETPYGMVRWTKYVEQDLLD